jgi:hypothetical protein
MERRPDDLSGMSPEDAKEYIFRHISTLKLTEKALGELEGEIEKWRGRIELARRKGLPDLAGEAEAERERLSVRRTALASEIDELKTQIESMRSQLPGLAARERRIDPDLLEQELLIALGRMPGDSPSPGGADANGMDAAGSDLQAVPPETAAPGNAGEGQTKGENP